MHDYIFIYNTIIVSSFDYLILRPIIFVFPLMFNARYFLNNSAKGVYLLTILQSMCIYTYKIRFKIFKLT